MREIRLNLFKATLAADYIAGSGVLQLQQGEGARLNLQPGEFIRLSMFVARSPVSTDNILFATAVNGDTLTVIGGQEGTVDRDYAAGSQVWNTATAGSLGNLASTENIQHNAFNSALDTGTVNAIVCAFNPPVIGTPGQFMTAQILIAHENTAAVTLNGINVINDAGESLRGGELKQGGVYVFAFNGTEWQVISSNLAQNLVIADAFLTAPAQVQTGTAFDVSMTGKALRLDTHIDHFLLSENWTPATHTVAAVNDAATYSLTAPAVGNYQLSLVAVDSRGNNSTADIQALETIAGAANTPPTGANSSLSVVESSFLTLTPGYFTAGYADADSDPMAAIKITQLPSTGMLTHTGTAISAVPHTVSLADLNAGRLVFNSGAVGFGNFRFKVNDGIADSLSDYQMSLTIYSAGGGGGGGDNSAPTGSVTITGDHFAGGTLNASYNLSHPVYLNVSSVTWSTGATGTSLALTNAHIGQSITATAHYEYGTSHLSGTMTSAAVTDIYNRPATGSVLISGDLTSYLQVNTTGLTDPDGAGTVQVGWYQADNGSGSGETFIGWLGNTLTGLVQGKYYRYHVVYSDPTYQIGSNSGTTTFPGAWIGCIANTMPTGTPVPTPSSIAQTVTAFTFGGMTDPIGLNMPGVTYAITSVGSGASHAGNDVTILDFNITSLDITVRATSSVNLANHTDVTITVPVSVV